MKNNFITLDTPDGRKSWGDIKVGDRVFASNGKPTRVTKKFPYKDWDFYKITFSDGTHTFAVLEHKWEVTTASDRKYNKGHRIVDTKEMMQTMHRSYRVPFCKPVEYQQKEVTLSPYIVGYLIGNSNLCGKYGIEVNCDDDNHYDYMQTLLPEGCFFRGNRKNYRCISANNTIGGNTVLNETISIGISGKTFLDKSVPNEYKYNSSETRLEILCGLMDSNGGICMRSSYVGGPLKYYRVQFSTSSKALRDDIIWIVRSFGGICNYTTDKRRGGSIRVSGRAKGKIIISKHDHYLIRINLPNHINPFRIKIKKDMYDEYVSKNKQEPVKTVKSIEYDQTGDGHCITVDAADSLYLANDFIVTHTYEVR